MLAYLIDWTDVCVHADLPALACDAHRVALHSAHATAPMHRGRVVAQDVVVAELQIDSLALQPAARRVADNHAVEVASSKRIHKASASLAPDKDYNTPPVEDTASSPINTLVKIHSIVQLPTSCDGGNEPNWIAPGSSR